ncbi:hypothetical protein MTP99_003169 [Tenebrio molitor]|jgi:hypothetical protein|nr:hypothetical protein MTP99_003169 [Tenebrio molitor]
MDGGDKKLLQVSIPREQFRTGALSSLRPRKKSPITWRVYCAKLDRDMELNAFGGNIKCTGWPARRLRDVMSSPEEKNETRRSDYNQCRR